jgi:outer membrane protein
VLPSGTLRAANDPLGLTATGGPLNGLTTTASNNFVPTVAVEYFVRPNISLETICCMTGHHVSATGPAGLAGVHLVDNIQIVPATLTAKYHFTGLPMGIKPYVGVGPTVFIAMADRPSAAVQGLLGITRTKLSSEVGAAFQAGFDAPIGHGYSLTIDAKKYLVNTDAHFYTAAHGDSLDAKLRLNPWVVSAGVSCLF